MRHGHPGYRHDNYGQDFGDPDDEDPMTKLPEEPHGPEETEEEEAPAPDEDGSLPQVPTP